MPANMKNHLRQWLRGWTHLRTWNQITSSHGEKAGEVLELLTLSAGLALASSKAGAQVGGLVGGPKGGSLGAGAGLGLGLVANVLILKWYFEKSEQEDDVIHVRYHPLTD